MSDKYHYLLHRPVIRLDKETTKIVLFDVLASEKGNPSLNECLYKGFNLIELLPDILDCLRMYPISITAYIEKTFLMLSVMPKDRDFLGFYFPCSEGQLIFRHCIWHLFQFFFSKCI